jgi:hypothetical protein
MHPLFKKADEMSRVAIGAAIEVRESLRFDVLVEGCLLLELKCVQEILPIHKAQLLSYMKLLDIPLGLIINFHEMKVVDGVVRMILPGANREAQTKRVQQKETKITKSSRRYIWAYITVRPKSSVEG